MLTFSQVTKLRRCFAILVLLFALLAFLITVHRFNFNPPLFKSEYFVGRAYLTRRRPIDPEGPEIHHLIFAKVHKAASSTLQNILLRFAMVRNLSILLPVEGNLISESDSKIPRSAILPHPEGERKFYDIFASHVIYDEKEISQYCYTSSVRFTIVREPLNQAVSAVHYYITKMPKVDLTWAAKKYKKDYVNHFIRHPKDFYNAVRGPANSYINNRMSVDLGFDLKDFEASKRNIFKVHAFIRKIERQFDFVLISDYFDESVVLMRRLLRWKMKDIVYIKVNTAVGKKDPILNSNIIQNFMEWSAIDSVLYSHFLDIFLNTIRNEQLFAEELRVFRTIQQEVNHFCLYDKVAKVLKIPKGVWNDAFSVDRSDCTLMTVDEPNLIDIAREHQRTLFKYYNITAQNKRHTKPVS